MINESVKVQNPSGLQVDAAGAFCDIAMSYDCKTKFYYRGENEANAKSVLSILGAGIIGGEIIELCCDGPDEKEAMKALIAHLSGN